MSNYLLVDETKWERALHCNIFKNFSNPLYGVTVELDVTKFINKIRKLETSFTFAMIFVTARCANEIEAFRYRFLDGRVVLYDQINTVFTYLDKETELFKVVDAPLTDRCRPMCWRRSRPRLHNRRILQRQREAMFFNFHRYLGSHIRNCLIHSPETKRTPSLFSIGESIPRERVVSCCLFPCRCITPLLMAFISAGFSKNCKQHSMKTERE